MPGLRVDAARNADRIVDAASALFEERGADVTLDEVARRAGVGVATVYRRFGTREGLVRAVLRAAFRSGIEPVAAVDTGDAWADLAAMLETVVTVIAAHRVAVRLARGTFAGEAVRTWLDTLDQPLQRARAAGVVRPELTARDLAAVVVMVLATQQGDAADADRRRYLALLLDGLRPGHAPLPPPSGP